MPPPSSFQTYTKVLSSPEPVLAGNSVQGAVTGLHWNGRKLSPPRDTYWEILRVRTYATGGTYAYFTNYAGIGTGAFTPGSAPIGGIWKNRIAAESEVLWLPSIEQRMKSYDPQQPITVHESDQLLFLIGNPVTRGDGTPWGIPFSVRFEVDVQEFLREGV